MERCQRGGVGGGTAEIKMTGSITFIRSLTHPVKVLSVLYSFFYQGSEYYQLSTVTISNFPVRKLCLSDLS